LNRLVIPILLTTISLLWIPSFVSADIKLTPPANWQPSPNNNSTQMMWFQNSTKSVFGIVKPQLNTTSPFFPLLRVLMPLILPNANSFIAQMLADQGILESTDQTTFGKSNYGYRYFMDVNLSSLSKILNTSETLLNNSATPQMSPDSLMNNSAISGMGLDTFIPKISPDTLMNNSAILKMLSTGSQIPFKGMLILAMKQGDFYGIFFLSPRQNFDTVFNQVKPTLDSIELTNSTDTAKNTYQ
jgi:hypothetical protein